MDLLSALKMELTTNEQLLTHLRDVEILAEDILADKQVHVSVNANLNS